MGILDSVQYFFTTSLIYTPIYAKNLFFNEALRHSSTNFSVSAGMAGFKSGDYGPMAGVGLGMRFFSSHFLSYKFDTRVFYHTAQNKSSNLLLMISVGLSFEFSDPVVVE